MNLESLIEKNKLNFYETSAKSNQNINETFDDIIKKTFFEKSNSKIKKVGGKIKRGFLESSIPDDEFEMEFK